MMKLPLLTLIATMLLLGLGQARELRMSARGASHAYNAGWLADLTQADDVMATYKKSCNTKGGKCKFDNLEVVEAGVDMAVVATDKQLKRCIGVFRGTQFDVVEDQLQNLRPGWKEMGGCEMRAAYSESYDDLKYVFGDVMGECMASCGSDCEVVLGGHSAGGAIAAVASLYYDDPYVMTFGAPRVFKDNCENVVNTDKHYRFVTSSSGDFFVNGINGMAYDMVPMLAGLGARHLGHTIILGDTSSRQIQPAYPGLNDDMDRIDQSIQLHWIGTVYLPRLKRMSYHATMWADDHIIHAKGWANGEQCGYSDECASGSCTGVFPPYKCT